MQFSFIFGDNVDFWLINQATTDMIVSQSFKGAQRVSEFSKGDSALGENAWKALLEAPKKAKKTLSFL